MFVAPRRAFRRLLAGLAVVQAVCPAGQFRGDLGSCIDCPEYTYVYFFVAIALVLMKRVRAGTKLRQAKTALTALHAMSEPDLLHLPEHHANVFHPLNCF